MRVIELFCWTFFAVCLGLIYCWDLYYIQQLTEMKPADWAAWVQGVGTIAAILGTWMVARHQTKSQIEEQKRVLAESNRIHQKVANQLIQQALKRIINAMEMVIFPERIEKSHISPMKLQGILQSLRILEGKSLRASLYEKIIEIQTLTVQALDILESHNGQIGMLTVRVQSAIAVQAVAQNWDLTEE